MSERQGAKTPRLEEERRKKTNFYLFSSFFPLRLGAFAFISICSVAAAPSTSPTTQPPGGRVVAPEKRDVPGQKFAIAEGEVYVPDFFTPGEKTDVVVWFLGEPWVVEQEFYDAHKNAVLLVANAQTRQNNFAGPHQFQNLLGNVAIALKKKEICDAPIGKVCLASFSGGYTALRQLLTFEETVAQV